MKRDMELIRKILVAMVDHPDPMGWVPLEFEGYSDVDVSYQVKLLADQGMVEATGCCSSAGFAWRAKRLTWDGHDYVEAIRDEGRWQKVKDWIKSTGKILTLETLKQGVKELFF